jgi:protocatechuate 3,4-dioxygenase beta subunit
LKGLGALAMAAAGCSSDAASPDEGVAAAGAGGAGQAPASVAGTSAGTAGSSAAAGTGAAGGASSSSAGSSGAAAAPAGGAPAAGGAGGAGGEAGGGAGSAGMAGGGGGGASTGLDQLQCIATPAMTEGPFFVEDDLDRSDLVMGETSEAIVNAVPLHLVIGVFEVDGMTCTPLSGVQVDIWHSDAVGVYSDVAPGAVQSVDTRGQKFLRGWQISDAQGVVAFDTIYPGWYMSRAIHIHFKLRMPGAQGAAREFTSQMFFDEAINAEVLAKPAYSGRSGTRSVLNDDDHIYNGTARNGQMPPPGTTPPGSLIMPLLTAMGSGYSATLKIGLEG